MRIRICSAKGKGFALLLNSFKLFLKEMYGYQWGESICGSWGFQQMKTSPVHIYIFQAVGDSSIIGTLSNDNNNSNVKKQLVLWENQLLCTCNTLLSTFLWRPLHDYDVKPPNLTFYGGRGHATTNFSSSFLTWMKSLRIQLQEKLPAFDILSGSK